jgi:hypothetical protein
MKRWHGCVNDEQEPIDDAPICESGKCDGPLDLPDSQIAATPCDGVMVDLSGRNNKKIAGRLNDPIANAVLKAGTKCPTTFKDILGKLREADKAKCPDTSQGLTTRFVSDAGQLTGQPSSMRAVVTRRCGERQEHEVLFSLFGLQSTATALPSRAEFIAFDSSEGVFNYYEADGAGKINFFGNSKDMLKGTGTGQGASQIRRCAACHTEGGLVMKEFDSPWLHWEARGILGLPSTKIPDSDDFIDKFRADLGAKADGINMEALVQAGNQLWNTSKIAFLKTSTTKDLLKPLFCTLDINLGSASKSPEVNALPGSAFLDSVLNPALSALAFFPVAPADYQNQIVANGQLVKGVPGKIETAFGFTHIIKSRIAENYINQLISAGIVDQNLVKDILMVDFTRPIFSKDRCDLLSKVPNIPVANLTPEKIRVAIKRSMGTPAAKTPGVELLANLKDKTDDARHAARIKSFTNACTALGSKKLVANALTVASLNRTIARGMPIIEFQETIVSDNLTVPAGTRLNPKTCELTTEFVPSL